MNKKKRKSMKKNRPFYIIQDSLDLHGYTKNESYELVIQFLNNAKENNLSKIEIITGIGNNSPNGKSVLLEHTITILEEYGFYKYIRKLGSIEIFL